MSTIDCACSSCLSYVTALKDALKPFAHHAQAGDSQTDARERTIRVTVGQLATAWFLTHGERQ